METSICIIYLFLFRKFGLSEFIENLGISFLSEFSELDADLLYFARGKFLKLVCMHYSIFFSSLWHKTILDKIKQYVWLYSLFLVYNSVIKYTKYEIKHTKYNNKHDKLRICMIFFIGTSLRNFKSDRYIPMAIQFYWKFWESIMFGLIMEIFCSDWNL